MLIELTETATDNKILINMDNVFYLSEAYHGGTIIRDQNVKVEVKETLEEVKSIINTTRLDNKVHY